MKDMGLRVEMEPTAALVPYARNAKRHTKEQVRQIANSIEKFGFADPVGVWTNAEGESEVVEGHGRVLAAQLLGIEEVPVIHLDALTDEQRRAYALAHNQLTMSTGWDALALERELDDLSLSFDAEEFGFKPLLDYGMDDLFAPEDSPETSGAKSSGSVGTDKECGVICPQCGTRFVPDAAR